MTDPVTEQALEDARWAVKWTDCAASGEAELYRIRGYRMARALLALAAENERLRASLGNGNQPCIYCNLPKEDWAKCRAGFPGCDRADDVMLCPNVGASLDADELNATLRERVAELEGALRNYAEWQGAAHEMTCPEDDTCNCLGKPINDAVNKVLGESAQPRGK